MANDLNDAEELELTEVDEFDIDGHSTLDDGSDDDGSSWTRLDADTDDEDGEQDDDAYRAGAGDTSFDNAASIVMTWSASAGVAKSAFVRDFTNGLRNRTDLMFWGSVDLEDEFPEPVAADRLRETAKWLVRMRNIAVFAPVGLTWWAISVVSPGFASFVDERLARGEDANFFQYWTQVEIDSSFAFLPANFFQIQDIARLGSLIILSIILATIVAQFMNWYIDRVTEDAMERRSQAIRAVRRALHSTREATPESLATSLAESMTELVESSRMIIDAARRLEQASVGVSQLEPTFQSLNDQLGRFDTRLGDTIIGSVDRLNSSVDGLSSLMDGNLRALLTESVAGIDEVRGQLHRTAASVEFGTQQLLKDLAQIPSQGRGGRPPGPAVSLPNGRG